MSVGPSDVVGKTRRRLAAELITELVGIDKLIKTANRELHEMIVATGSSLRELSALARPEPAGCSATSVTSPGSPTATTSHPGPAPRQWTPPAATSSGIGSPASGNGRINRVLHIMATVQLRNPTDGRAYLDHRKATEKASMEAMRCLQRRRSDIVYNRMRDDAQRLAASPGLHPGATLQSSAADSHRDIDTSDQSLPGPANHELEPSSRGRVSRPNNRTAHLPAGHSASMTPTNIAPSAVAPLNAPNTASPARLRERECSAADRPDAATRQILTTNVVS